MCYKNQILNVSVLFNPAGELRGVKTASFEVSDGRISAALAALQFTRSCESGTRHLKLLVRV